MKRPTRMLVTGCIMTLTLMTIASGQDPFPEPTVESRILQLEDTVARLSTLVQMRTEVSGPEDRVTRDFTLDQRLNNIELGVQQVQRQVMDLEQRVFSVANTASQAQRDAQMAQQMARDAMYRVN